MKLIGKLKERVEKAASLDEAKAIIAEAGMELTQEEMNTVTGGDIKRGFTNQPHCKSCGNVITPFGGVYKCSTPGCPKKGEIQQYQDMDWY